MDFSCLNERILAAKARPLNIEKLLAACDILSRELASEAYLPLLTAMMPEAKAREELSYASLITSEKYLRERLKRELGQEPGEFIPCGSETLVRQARMPLGVILHIAAGNVDALPVFSVLEGLLTGNINLLKLPSGEGGLSQMLLDRLIELEPSVADFAYVFDVPSTDIESLKSLARLADCIVVWGGDEAVSALRRLAPPDVRLIEWGHKLSFAYVSGDPENAALEGIAVNICETEQLFCSSCQGIFYDTDDPQTALAFAERFLPILARVSKKYPRAAGIFGTAKSTLELYTTELEAIGSGTRILRGGGCSVTFCPEGALAPSKKFRNCWVAPLPRERILSELSPYKNRLQTAALVCPKAERPDLERLLFAAGVVRITTGERMSRDYCGMPHDGAFPLRLYTRTVSAEE